MFVRTPYAPLLGGALALFAVALPRPAEAQMLDPEPVSYTLVGEDRGPEVLWSNPAALGFASEDRALGLVSFGPNPGRTDAEFQQALLGARLGAFGLGVRRERFRPEPGAEPLMGTGLTFGLGFAGESFALGAAHDQYRRGVSSSRWEIAGMWRVVGQLTVGAAWRDIGSPVIISQERGQRIVAGATVTLGPTGASLSVESVLQDGSFVGHRALGRARLADVEVHASMEVDEGRDPLRFGFGVGYRFGATRPFGVLQREVERAAGDATRFLLGASRVL